MRFLPTSLIVLAAGVWLAISSLPGMAEEGVGEPPDRFAFIIGNSAYETFGGNKIPGSPFNLVTPANDARRYAEAFDELNWQVLNSAKVERSAEAIRRDLEVALNEITPESEVVFVFNGHGFSNGEENFIVGVPASDDSYASTEEMIGGSIKIDYIVERLASRNPGRIVLIINACGDEPPLLASLGTAPARMTFPNVNAEVLVLYSSSPRGVAYDFINNKEKATEGYETTLNSPFTRSFIAEMMVDQPLLQAFTAARIETERLSIQAAAFRRKPALISRQIPHVVHDSINGRFNLSDATATLLEASQQANWRLAPSSCRLNSENLAEALALREDEQSANASEQEAVVACILQAALQDLGVERITFDGIRGGVVFETVAADSQFKQRDLISSVSMRRSDGSTATVDFKSLNEFQETLYQNVRKEGTRMVFTREGDPETGGGSTFVSHKY